MAKDDVRVLADEVVKPILDPVGFTSSDVDEPKKHVGENTLYMTLHAT